MGLHNSIFEINKCFNGFLRFKKLRFLNLFYNTQYVYDNFLKVNGFKRTGADFK